MSLINSSIKVKSKFFNKIKNKIGDVTYQSVVPSVLKNAKFNKKFLKYGKSIKELRDYNKKKKNAIIIGAGPSLRRNNQIKVIKKFANKFIIIACDGSLFYLLSNNIVPDLVVTFDPHPSRVIRWFGDEKLNKKKIAKDDYFARQDLEVMFNNELKMNEKVIKLFNKYAKKLNIAVGTSSAKNVVKRVISSKSNLYWWNPYLDDPKSKNSVTKKIFNMNKFPIVNTGGNVGATAWMFADSLFGCEKIGLLGMDFSYYLDTKLSSTQYYDKLKKFTKKEDLKMFYSKIFNPKVKKYFYTDHVYAWYKKCLLEMINNSDAKTVNCSGGGILFDKNIQWTSLNNFCKQYSS